MSKPYPIIHLPNPLDHERLIRGLYRMGYRTGVTRRNWTEDRTWGAWRDAGAPLHVYLYLYEGRYISRSVNMLPHRTLVNSVNHFLEYTRRHHAIRTPVNLLPTRGGSEHETLVSYSLSDRVINT